MYFKTHRNLWTSKYDCLSKSILHRSTLYCHTGLLLFETLFQAQLRRYRTSTQQKSYTKQCQKSPNINWRGKESERHRERRDREETNEDKETLKKAKSEAKAKEQKAKKTSVLVMTPSLMLEGLCLGVIHTRLAYTHDRQNVDTWQLVDTPEFYLA